MMNRYYPILLSLWSGSVLAQVDSSWRVPVGIPMPDFGITNSVWMYTNSGKVWDYGSGDEPYRTNQYGPYTHYVDKTHPSATDSGNTWGSESVPRLTFPYPLSAGSAVQVHGTGVQNAYTFDNVGPAIIFGGSGTSGDPIFIYGIGNHTNEATLAWFENGDCRMYGNYVIVENLGFTNIPVRLRVNEKGSPVHHIAIRESASTAPSRSTASFGLDGYSPTYWATNIVLFRVWIHDWGDWQSPSEDDSGQFIFGNYTTNAWALEVHSWHNGADLGRLGSDQSDPRENSHQFVGRTYCYENRENALDVKQTVNAVISENVWHTFAPSSSSGGVAANAHYNPTNVWYIHNRIYNCNRGIAVTGTDGSIYVIGNTFYDCSEYGLYFYGGSTVMHAAYNTFVNCASGIYQNGGSTAATVGNVFYGGTNFNHRITDSSGSLSNNLYYPPADIMAYWGSTDYSTLAALQSGSGKAQNSLAADPLFLSIAADDFHLTAPSPARDAGGSTLGDYDAIFQATFGVSMLGDIDGDVRPLGGGYDIGADEFSGTIVYVDGTIGPASCSDYDPVTRSCGSGAQQCYKTVDAAADAASPGETILIRSGTYPENVTPGVSGEPDNYITFRNYPGESPVIQHASTRAWDVTDRVYLWFEGLTHDDTRWMEIQNSHWLVITNCVFTDNPAGGTTGNVRFVNSHSNIVTSCVISNGNDNLGLIQSDYNKIENNTIVVCRHSCLTVRCADYNVIRGNYFASPTQKCIEVFDCGEDTSAVPNSFNSTWHNVIEENVMADGELYYSTSRGNGIQYSGQGGIIRRNTFYECNVGVAIQNYADEALYGHTNRVYHNVFYAQGGAGLATRSGVIDNQFINNICLLNTGCASPDCLTSSEDQFTYRTPLPATMRLRHNALYHSAPGQDVISVEFGAGTTLAAFQAANPTVAYNNVETDPLFVNAAAFNFQLQAGSPMIDAGGWLTTTSGAGSGTTLAVVDAWPFYNGFGIPGLVGDEIQLEGQSVTATVTAVDYDTHTLTLDTSLTWTDGQGVALAYNGDAPDMGRYEYASSPPPSGQRAVRTATLRVGSITVQ